MIKLILEPKGRERRHEMRFKRMILIVLDSVGIGAMSDAKQFGDEGAHTLGHIASAQGGLSLPNLESLGLGAIEPILGLKPQAQLGCYGKMNELSSAKDTTSGHWEISGCPVFKPFPTYPQGFPPEVIEKFTQVTGYEVIGNKPASGTEIITELGPEHLKTGKLIVYTSADSVLQIAAHEEVIPVEKLYEICRQVRSEVCIGPHAVGRIIARPFIGEAGRFVRTPKRHDFSLPPQGRTVLDDLRESHAQVIGVGKISDIFAGQGLTESFPTTSNHDGMEKVEQCLTRPFEGLLFANLVDFDSSYGHRRNAAGYAEALAQFDQDLGALLPKLKETDLLIITADHGCDPTASGSDHTREYVPLLVYTPNLITKNLGIRSTFADIGATIAENFSLPLLPYGASFLTELEVK